MQRNQSEDYSRPEDVLVYRDAPGGYSVTRAIDEATATATKPAPVVEFIRRTVLAPPAGVMLHSVRDTLTADERDNEYDRRKLEQYVRFARLSTT